MPSLLLNSENARRLKSQIRSVYEIPSSHLSEAIASALGFRTNAALLTAISELPDTAITTTLNDEAFIARLSDLGHSLDREWRGFASFASEILSLDESDATERIYTGKKFCMVWNLWIAPDFTRVLAGKDSPPWVNHDVVDFDRLRSALADEFRFGPPVNIRLGNDTVDQTVVHGRELGGLSGPLGCEDFSEKLWAKAKLCKSTIVEIRQEWRGVQFMKDRRNAPPPVLIPIIVEAQDAEDNIIWGQSTKLILGMKSGSFDYPFLPQAQRSVNDSQGRLSPRLQKVLAEIFGIKYQPFVTFGIGATDPKPVWLNSIWGG